MPTKTSYESWVRHQLRSRVKSDDQGTRRSPGSHGVHPALQADSSVLPCHTRFTGGRVRRRGDRHPVFELTPGSRADSHRLMAACGHATPVQGLIRSHSRTHQANNTARSHQAGAGPERRRPVTTGEVERLASTRPGVGATVDARRYPRARPRCGCARAGRAACAQSRGALEQVDPLSRTAGERERSRAGCLRGSRAEAFGELEVLSGDAPGRSTRKVRAPAASTRQDAKTDVELLPPAVGASASV
jgi:hypothetical protein